MNHIIKKYSMYPCNDLYTLGFSIVIVYWPKILLENTLVRLELKLNSTYELRYHWIKFASHLYRDRQYEWSYLQSLQSAISNTLVVTTHYRASFSYHIKVVVLLYYLVYSFVIYLCHRFLFQIELQVNMGNANTTGSKMYTTLALEPNKIFWIIEIMSFIYCYEGKVTFSNLKNYCWLS